MKSQFLVYEMSMKFPFLLGLIVILVACSHSNEDMIEQPVAPWTYPISGYRVIKIQASRSGEKEITRLVGWDEDYYYFDWWDTVSAIGRATGRVERAQFDVENRGALTLEKGRITVRSGQVRTLQLQ